ncbi:MAG TPA: hypothetical protein VJT49_32840 [Amycolatopsis sp.]|uniref:hypothetical protein n=1 Tax=Amycolatopsis sp. TaxID=37632 RepID=UPI002B47AE62|nr:hypothetical protein [Amycolatopsis sp.]HKS49811.1 hypothetical protein [Amycolatopsis sp.]
MGIAALIAWVLTALGGFVMLGIWVARGGTRRPRRSAFPPGLIFGHFGLAAAGLVLWIVYLVTDSAVLGWVALILLVPVAVLGFTMLVRWIPAYQAGRTPVTAGAKRTARTGGTGLPERAFPVPVVGAHGLLAVATVVLVLLADLGIGGS